MSTEGDFSQMRKLASVQRISNITPIPDADNIETIHVLGWTVVCKKGIHHIGESIIYFEIDSFLPIQPEYEFLRDSSYKVHPSLGEGFRLKTRKMRKQLSQGLVISLPEEFKDFPEGTDVTDLMGIQKYETELPVRTADVKGSFPFFIYKTDQERIQNLYSPQFIEDVQGMEFETTEKLDGTSATFFFNEEQVGVCSRNLELKLDQENNKYVNIFKQLKMEEAFRGYSRNIAIQGEIIGPKIQGNYYNYPMETFYVFDIYLIDEQRYATSKERLEILSIFEHTYGCKLLHVPILGIVTISPEETVSSLLEKAEGKSLINSSKEREGVVYKSTTLFSSWCYKSNTLSFKAISNKFLLKDKS